LLGQDRLVNTSLSLRQECPAASLAAGLELPFRGDAMDVVGICRLGDARAGLLTFSVKESVVAAGTLVLSASDPQSGAWLVTDRPRLMFAKALAWLDAHIGFHNDETQQIAASARIAASAAVANGVTIGERTVVCDHVRIAPGVSIGDDCVIKSGAVIGEDGFGFERDIDGTPVRLIHRGGVRIGNRVEIGSVTTVCQGTLAPTVVEDDAKIDDHVHIAHNVHVGKKAMVIACAEVSGSVRIGERAWVGPNASILEGVKIGDDAFIGLAAVVLRDVAPNVTVVGNPARVLERKS
jgi:UDP-3-O-[3-hydroxymyristoyl] glucosamine N-acyltransferase